MGEGWQPPEVLEEYRLVRALGRGATSLVYLAHDTILERPVAIKFAAWLAPDARDRFVAEARAAARLQHPNVATLFRVGEFDGRPFLVTEYVRGRSLAELPLPVPWRQVLELAVGLARGLAAAHRHGVLHRDIKLANAIMSDQGEVKLIDFGLATIEAPSESPEPATAEDAIVGTPNYLAPELWRGEPASRRSDIYALGVCLYILACERPPTLAHDPSTLAVRLQHVDPAPPHHHVANIDARLSAIIGRCVRRQPAERFASGAELLVALESLFTEERAGVAPPPGNPYRGLRPFESEHRGLFFGRAAEIALVVDRLRQQPFALVAGDSGVGKSSLCRAGVIPRIREGALDPSRAWSAFCLTPGRRPGDALLEALARHLASASAPPPGDPAAVEEALRRAPRSIGLVVFIDQLEELVTLASPEQAALAWRILAALASALPGVRLLASARGDFLTRLAQQPGLSVDLAGALVFVGPLNPDGIRQAVVGPAAAKQVRFESDALVDRLVAAGVEGSLPLLQFALAELWEARDHASAVITSAALERLGGVSGALARHADDTLARLGIHQRRAARTVLLRLVTVDATRASLSLPELVGDDPNARSALEALVAARLLVVREQLDGFVYELAHEALISGWTTLRLWLDEEVESRETRRRLELAASAWDQLGRPREQLWPAAQLPDLRALDPGSLRPRESAFVAASEARVRRLRLARLAGIASLPLVTLLAASGLWLARRAALDRELQGHLARAGELVAEAAARDAELVALRSSAFAEFDAHRLDAGEAAWARARALRPPLVELYARATHELELALQIDPTRAGTRAALGDLLLVRALAYERDSDPDAALELSTRLELYDDDRTRRARWRAPATLDVTTDPPGARAEIERYEDSDGRTRAVPVGDLATPLQLPPGSYRLTFSLDGHARVRYPVLLARGEHLDLRVRLPAASAVPPGFVYVPEGRFLFGSRADEDDLRRGFYGTVPQHEMSTPAFLIAVHETTYGDWIDFLTARPAAASPSEAPPTFQSAPTLTYDAGAWRLAVVEGDARRLLGPDDPWARAGRSPQDWRRLPIGAITWEEALRYTAWLDQSGRVSGARPCTELEWERAARGADGRRFPSGDALDPRDANFDETYGRDPDAMGPDEVGAHPASESPFGLHDLAGNVYEWTAGAHAPAQRVARGGAFFFGSLSARSVNRNIVAPDFRDGTLGLRVCADPR